MTFRLGYLDWVRGSSSRTVSLSVSSGVSDEAGDDDDDDDDDEDDDDEDDDDGKAEVHVGI